MILVTLFVKIGETEEDWRMESQYYIAHLFIRRNSCFLLLTLVTLSL